jgi:putative transcriptional regulator
MKSLQGHLLIAAPNLIDPNFFRTVILMVQHNDDGALGLVLNRPTGTAVREAWAQVGQTPCLREDVLHHGGPCEGPLMVVHTCEGVSPAALLPGLYFATEKDDVESVIGSGDGQARFFVGYAGWSAGQLENELGTGSWVTLPASAEHVFTDDIHLWENATRQVARMAAYPNIKPSLVPRDPKMN